MSAQVWRLAVGVLIALGSGLLPGPALGEDGSTSRQLRAVLLTAEMATETRLQQLRSAGYSAAVLMLSGEAERAATADRHAVERIGKSGLDVYYWIELEPLPGTRRRASAMDGQRARSSSRVAAVL
jgi:hypothetical protein